MRCHEVFHGGCDHEVGPGSWVHDDSEWIDGDHRPRGPWLRADLPTTLLRELAADSDWRVRELVAKYPGTPPKIVDVLARDPVARVRWEGLRCTRSVALLRGPLDDAERASAAANDRCPADLLERWSTDTSHIVRDRVVRHPSTPSRAVDAAIDDPDGNVRALAAARTSNQKVIAAAVASPDPGVRYGAARNPACPPHLLRRLAADEAPSVRAQAANPPSRPVGFWRRLLRPW